MALKDCIKKLDGLVSKEDITQLEQYIAEGLSDEEAVRRLTLESDYNVVMITKRAKEEGATVANRPGFLADIRSIQKKRAEGLHAERVKLEKELLELNKESKAKQKVLDAVRKAHNVNHAADQEFKPLDIYDDQQLNTALSSMLFDPELRAGLKSGKYTLKGKSPEQLVTNFKVFRDREAEIRERIREILVLDGILIDKLEEMGERTGKRFFQKVSQLDSPAFKGWFGDSKIVDENGKPLVVYHGTKAEDFDAFQAKYDDGLIFFTKDPEFASSWMEGTGGLREPPADTASHLKQARETERRIYNEVMGDNDSYDLDNKEDMARWDANRALVRQRMKDETGYSSTSDMESKIGTRILPVYLSIQNPFDPRRDYQEIEDFLRGLDGFSGVIEQGSHKAGNWVIYENKAVIEELKRMGYDGIYLTENIGGKHDTIAAFSPEQVKSSSGNQGTFDPSNPNILYQMDVVNPLNSPAFKLWFGDSKVVDKDGKPRLVYHGTQFTDEPIEVFEPQGGFGGWNNLGTWFSSELKQAQDMTLLPRQESDDKDPRGPVIPAYISIQNPLNTSFDGLQMIIAGLMKKQGISQFGPEAGPAIKAHLQKLGYDGVIIKDFTGDGAPTQDVYVAFESNQIKSPENQGTFDPSNPNILYQLDQDELGFRSGLLSAVRIMPQEKGSAEQMLAYLRKQPGVKKQELEWIDFEAWANAKGTVTRDEMIAYVEENGVQVLETQYGGVTIRDPHIIFDINENATETYRAGDLGEEALVYDAHDDHTNEFYTVYVDGDAGMVSVTPDDGKTWLEMQQWGVSGSTNERHRLLEIAKHAISIHSREKQKTDSGFEGRALWEDQYQLEGGTNYREVVLHLPSVGPSRDEVSSLHHKVVAAYNELSGQERKALNEFYAEQWTAGNGEQSPLELQHQFLNAMRAGDVHASDFTNTGLEGSEVQKAYIELVDGRKQYGKNYDSHTFGDVPNILAWMRIKDRVGPNGEKILFIEEIQSDWHSAGREMGYNTADNLDNAKYKVRVAKGYEQSAADKADEYIEKIVHTGVEGGNVHPSGHESMKAARQYVEDRIIGRSNWAGYFSSLLKPDGLGRDELGSTKAAALEEVIGSEGLAAIEDWRLRKLELSGAERNLTQAESGGIPDAPFKGNAWAELAMKRLIRLAAEGGYDQIAWTTGDQQADRYDLGNKVNSITWSESHPNDASIFRSVNLNYVEHGGSDTVFVDRHGTMTAASASGGNFDDWIGKKLSEAVGTEIAEEIMGDMPADGSMGTVDGDGLRTGGEGMQNFYDKVLVNVLNKAARKLDKKAKVDRFGGAIENWDLTKVKIIDLDSGWVGHYETMELARRAVAKGKEQGRHFSIEQVPDPSATIPVHKLDISADISAGAMEGQTLFQKERGSITFDEMRRGLIRLTATRNQSTFLHEAGHLYLEVMRSLAEGPGAPQEIKDDWQKILKHLDITEGRQITTEHHELWARSFEKYLMEGRAPSIELQDAFNSFKRWLELIYSKLNDLVGIELNDEIRGVFDRILASEQQITQAERVQEFAAIFSTAEDMGVSQEVFDVYRKGVEREHQEAVAKETARMLAAMNREGQKIWQQEEDKVREEVTAEAHQTKIFIALAMLQRGKQPDGSPTRMSAFKIDKASLLRLLDDNQESLNALPRPFIYSIKGGVDVDLAAQTLGYESGNQLIQEIMRTPKMSDWIDGTTEARMAEKFPDPMLDGTLADEAIRAVHSDRRAVILATEMRAFNKLARADAAIVRATKQTIARTERQSRDANLASLPKKLEIAQIKAAARIEIGKKQQRALQPHVYLAAEQKAGRAAFKASNSKDFAEAALQKRKQIMNHEMYRAALRAKKMGESTQKYLAKFEQKRVQQRLGKSGMLDRILAVIEGVNFRKISLKQVDREKALDEMLQAIEDGRLIAPPSMLAKLKGNGTNWQDLTVEEFAAMRDMVKQLEHMAKALAEAVVNGEKVILKEASLEVANQIYDNNKEIDLGISQENKRERFKKGKSQAIMTWLRPSSIARVLDKSGFGALTRHIIVPMRRAYAERLIPGIHNMQKDVSKLYLKHYTRAELGKQQKRKLFEPIGEELSKGDILSIALNWGNAGNRSALLGGIKRNKQPAYTDQGVRAALATLDERDWLFVQEVWDYIDSYWGDLSAAEQRRRGIMPQKVEATPFTIRTSDGKDIAVKGGYYPLVYDRRHSKQIKAKELEDLYKQMGNGVFISTSTRAGATYDRVKNHGFVVKLGLNHIETHLREIIRDIAIGDEVNFIKRVLNSAEVQDAFNQTGNESALNTLDLWLTDAAVGELPAEGIYEQSASWIRTGFTKAKLAWNALVTILQFTGIAQTVAVIGTKSYVAGLNKFIQNPSAAWAHVMATSKFMEARYSIGAWDKDVADTKAHLESFFGAQPTRVKVAMNAMSATYFWPIARAQQVVDVTTWLGAFEKGRNVEQLTEADAVLYADAQVEAAQTSGFFSDRSGLERGTLGNRKNRQAQFIRIWTTLISYMLAKGNIAYEKTGTTDFRKPTQVAAYVGDLILLYTVEGIASAIIYGQWPDDTDEPEDWAWWAAEKTLESIVSGIPFVREIPGSKFGGGNTPIGSFLHDAWDLNVQVMQGDMDSALRKKFITTTGTLFHYPSSQTNRFFDAVWSEDDPEWYEYIVGDRDK